MMVRDQLIISGRIIAGGCAGREGEGHAGRTAGGWAGCEGESYACSTAGGFCKSVSLRFYAELNDFLHPLRKQRLSGYPFRGVITVREAIESLGVPHTAVDLVLVNGNPESLSCRLHHGDVISVYPEFETFDVSGISQVRRKPLRTSRFMVDAHLGKLARDLRMLGFDSAFAGTMKDETLIETAVAEKRIILTRDRELLKSGKVDHGYYVRATTSRTQCEEVVRKFDLWSQFNPFSRCLVCNGELVRVPVEEVRGEIKEETAQPFKDFFRCSGCHHVFWEGSHYGDMRKKVQILMDNRKSTP